MKAKGAEKGGLVAGIQQHFSLLHNDPDLSGHNKDTQAYTPHTCTLKWGVHCAN